MCEVTSFVVATTTPSVLGHACNALRRKLMRKGCSTVSQADFWASQVLRGGAAQVAWGT